MAQRYDVDVKDVLRQLRRLGVDVAGEVKDLHGDAAKVVEKRAVREVPVRSGALRSTIRSSGTKSNGVIRAGKARVPYAAPIHYGWPKHGIEPNPFLVRALDSTETRVRRVLEDGIARIVRRYQ